jgi:hypothetical protein
VEQEVGSRLPADYKELVAVYGAGSWDEFLHVFQPAQPNEYVDLARQGERARWALDYLQAGGERIPYPIADLLAVARTDNGDTVYWLQRPRESPDTWTIVVNEARVDDWVEYDGAVVDFLADVLSAVFRCGVFPEDFPSRRPRFTPYD